MMPFGFFSPGPWEMVMVLLIGVLLFGKRLPEVGRSLGKGIVEFKNGINGLGDDDEAATTSSASESAKDSEEFQEASAPKFEPPKA
jgi:sec-independent protein translocase protein TatA